MVTAVWQYSIETARLEWPPDEFQTEYSLGFENILNFHLFRIFTESSIIRRLFFTLAAFRAFSLCVVWVPWCLQTPVPGGTNSYIGVASHAVEAGRC